MREIKFRAWNDTKIEYAHMMLPEDIINLEGETSKNISENIHLMQYTGLKDKNGKEIYEGDIVTILDCEPSTYKIEYCDNTAIFAIMAINPKDGDWEREDFQGIDSNECEVIGNIYENPELLT